MTFRNFLFLAIKPFVPVFIQVLHLWSGLSSHAGEWERVGVANSVGTAIAVGEEWRTVFDAQDRIDRGACAIVQPEMGHKGITQFMRIARYAEAHHLEVIPHATIGTGIFMAASLQAAAAIQSYTAHEYQHFVCG